MSKGSVFTAEGAIAVVFVDLLRPELMPHSSSATSFKVFMTSSIENGSSALQDVAPVGAADFLTFNIKNCLTRVLASGLKVFMNRSTNPLLVINSGLMS